MANDDVQTQDLTPDGQALATVLSAVEANPSLAQDPEIANALKFVSGDKAQAKGGDDAAKDKDDAKPDDKDVQAKDQTKSDDPPTKTDDKKTQDKDDKKSDDDDDDDDDVKSIFFKKKSGKSVEIKGVEDLEKYVKEKYSIDDLGTYFTSVDNWRNAAQDAKDYEAKVEDIERAFEQMPEPLFNAFNAWANGQSWEEQIASKGDLNFNKDLDSHDLFEVVNHYFPGDFNKEDMTGDQDDPTLKRAISISKKQFKADRKAFEDQRASYLEKAEERQENLKESVDGSVDTLRKTFPDFDKSALKKVRNVMIGDGLNKLFFNNDGSWKGDAAEKIAFALFGKDEVSKFADRAKKSQKTLEDTVSRGSDKPSVKHKQSQQTVVPEEVTKLFKDVMQQTYY